MQALRPAFVKILGRGRVVGNGFVGPGGRVITCAHVVAQALDGCDAAQPESPRGEVGVVFPWAPGQPERGARVVPGGWRPNLPVQTGDHDIAVLALEGGLPGGVEPLMLARGLKEEFEVHFQPFVPEVGRSVPITGRCFGRDEFSRLVLRADEDGSQFVEPGVSGAPILAKHGEVVEGIAEQRDRGVRQAFVCPADAIRRVLNDLDRAEGAPAFMFMNDEDASRFANRRCAAFDLYAPSQQATPGAGLELQLSASFDRVGPWIAVLKEVELHLDPPATVVARRGAAKACDATAVTLQALGLPRQPYWRLAPRGGGALDGMASYEVPPLCAIPDAADGQELSARMTCFLDRIELRDEADDEEDLSLVKRRILSRLRLKDLGDPGEDGDILLGEIAGQIWEVRR